MERLTERDEYGNADIKGVDGANLQLNLDGDEFCRVTDALNMLAAYEDTDLSPEEVAALAEAKAEGRLPLYYPNDVIFDRKGNEWTVRSSEIHKLLDEVKILYRCGHEGTMDYYAMYQEETYPTKEAALEAQEATP